MPDIPEIRVPAIREITPMQLPDVAPVTGPALGLPVVDLPGCVAVHPDANLNPSLLKDDPGRVGMYCPDGQVPSFRPMDYNPAEMQNIGRPSAESDKGESKPEPVRPAEVPRVPAPGQTNEKSTPEAAPKPNKTVIEQVADGLPEIPIVVTTATIALVAATSALAAKPLADLILKLIKPTIKKTVKKVSQLRGKAVKVESVRERVLAQRDRNRAVMALRRALKP